MKLRVKLLRSVLIVALLLLGTIAGFRIRSRTPRIEPARDDTSIDQPAAVDELTWFDASIEPTDLTTWPLSEFDLLQSIPVAREETPCNFTHIDFPLGGCLSNPASRWPVSGRFTGWASFLREVRKRRAEYDKMRQSESPKRADSELDEIDSMLSSIKREWETHDLLVVWLIDNTLSQFAERERIVSRIEMFYQDVERKEKQSYKLMSALVGFGEHAQEVVKPTFLGSDIVSGARELPLCESGQENVMTAIGMVLDAYGKRWKGGMYIVVWTDEAGDDLSKAERTTLACNSRDAAVSVIGRSATLGSERGTQLYVDAGTGFEFRLSVKHRPDSWRPERLLLPYWFESPLPPWTAEGVQVSRGFQWYGGPQREGLLSRAPPHALTWLAHGTGGWFVLLDSKEDRSPFKPDWIRRYFSEYCSADEYDKRVQESPLRRAVSGAVAICNETNMMPPSTMFVLERDPHYPYPIVNTSHTPAQFRSLVRAELRKQQVDVTAAALVIDEALAQFPADDMEAVYANERSPRWRAWYDLNRGRLLAMKVRHREYHLACDRTLQPGFLAQDTNQVVFKPSKKLRSGESTESLARGALRLLERCKKENSGTPWEFLAQWELQSDFGIEIEQVVRPASPLKDVRPPDPPIRFPKL